MRVKATMGCSADDDGDDDDDDDDDDDIIQVLFKWWDILYTARYSTTN